MTKEEFIAQRFASKLKLAKQALLLAEIEKRHNAQLETLLEAPKQIAAQLEAEDEHEQETLMPLADLTTFKRHDFVRYGNDEYYEVQKVAVSFTSLYSPYSDVSPDKLTHPPKDFLKVKLECLAIRKSGTLARWHTTLDADNSMLHKAYISEHLCLRRALKQRMRRRLEGGD